jgi:DNA-binding transcriptional regulator YdaS (Cro superfamily)
MTFHQWLKQKRGRTSQIAQHFGVSVSAICQWHTNGIPPKKILEVHALTKGKVPLKNLLSGNA